MNIPRLIAHRGYARRYPENTLLAVDAALRAGACFIEVDVQLSADGIPVLIHDAELWRTADVPGSVLEMAVAELEQIPVGEPRRFGDIYPEARVSTLAALVERLKDWPGAAAFIEIKEESLERFGTEVVVSSVMGALEPVAERCIPISFNAAAVGCARSLGAGAVGWVIGRWGEAGHATAVELAPQYLFCNYRKLPEPPGALWRGPWQWALYEVTDPALALALARRGADLIETMAIGEMLEDPILRRRGCFAD